jgi:hypothetical protein
VGAPPAQEGQLEILVRMKIGPRSLLAVAMLAAAFGVATIAKGAQVLFGPAVARADAGQYVPFVVWFNFLAGFAYVAAGAGIALRRRWSSGLAAAIAGATALVFLAFGAHVLSGGAFEVRTVAALTLRTATWVAIALVTRRRLSPGQA